MWRDASTRACIQTTPHRTSPYHTHIGAERIDEGANDEIHVQFEAHGLPKFDGLFRKADPYYEILCVPPRPLHSQAPFACCS